MNASPEDPGQSKPRRKSFNGFGLAIGIAVGAAVGAATDNIGLWVAIGVVIGIALEQSGFMARKK
jgi:hypothetical protein